MYTVFYIKRKKIISQNPKKIVTDRKQIILNDIRQKKRNALSDDESE